MRWNSATLKIYDSNDDSSEESGISKGSTDDDSDNSENEKDSSEMGENFTSNIKKDIIDSYAESQQETIKQEPQKTQEYQQEKKEKVPLVYYPGLNLDFSKLEDKTNKTINKTNYDELNFNYYGEKQSVWCPTNTEEYYQYYWTMSDWYYNGYSENGSIGWYNYEGLPPSETTSNIEQPPLPGITSNLEIQPQPPGIMRSDLEMLSSPSWTIGSLETHPLPSGISTPSFNLSEQIQQISKDQITNNNIEVSNVEDYLEDDNDMDLSD